MYNLAKEIIHKYFFVSLILFNHLLQNVLSDSFVGVFFLHLNTDSCEGSHIIHKRSGFLDRKGRFIHIILDIVVF